MSAFDSGNSVAAQRNRIMDFLRTRSHIKSFIVYMAVYGLIPISFAEWLIRVGELRHEKTF